MGEWRLRKLVWPKIHTPGITDVNTCMIGNGVNKAQLVYSGNNEWGSDT